MAERKGVGSHEGYSPYFLYNCLEGCTHWSRVILGLYRDNGKENGNYHSILGLYYFPDQMSYSLNSKYPP